MNKTKDLSELSLLDLHILKSHAMISFSKMERLMGDMGMGIGAPTSFEVKDFQLMGNIYKLYEDEMNKRIMTAALEDYKNL
jgi:hypothetical protein